MGTNSCQLYLLLTLGITCPSTLYSADFLSSYLSTQVCPASVPRWEMLPP